MASFVSTLLFLLLAVGGIKPAVNQPTEPMCFDWGESSDQGVSVLEGEVGWLSCPLFSHPSVYNYSSTQSTGHNLFWYRLPEGHDLEQPLTYSSRISRDGVRLWLQPSSAADTGLYICMLRNKTSCSKMAMRLSVLRPSKVLRANDCDPPVAWESTRQVIPFQKGGTMDCPDLKEAGKMADNNTTVTVTWYNKCKRPPFVGGNRQLRGVSLRVHIMLGSYEGLYFCTVSYQRRGRPLNFTRSINLSAVNPPGLPKIPTILNPAKEQIFTVKQDSEVRLVCKALLPYLEDTPWDLWWTVDGKTLDKLPDRFSKTNRLLSDDHGDRTEESVLLIQDFSSEDLNREFNCSVKNEEGVQTRRAALQLEVWVPSVELGVGLGATLVLMLLLFIIYHVFWLELLLLYRSWFGTDERHTDDKEYDLYISYARGSEEELFVLSTLRSVLENELGYSVCIFDRDSLPGGTITDETLSFVSRSRRLLVVLGPGYASRGSQALLELQVGLDSMARGGQLRVILVQYQPGGGWGLVRELRSARVVLALVRWQGDKSRDLTSRFWKRLRVELPVRRGGGRGEEGGKGLRLQSQNSTNSQTGLITNSIKHPQKVFQAAA
ncbi:interleukin-1 receptor accessory protein [Gymnodraco acuticeps]|uniref:Interleukin-1 receptor accessory protein n=1 Tax=Gymnodraco acuticeps TaxID=8218 RepID=A0A6P8TTN9_GYMAC|nr:interleukin-1 receptor accessory protein [Gymnodraco acuticeps]